VLCSFILSSPLFCFLTFIKSRPFSNYQVTVFIKIWIVNFEILNMKWPVLMWLRYNFSKEKSLSHRFTVTGLPVHQSTVISLQSSVTSSPVYQFSTHNSLLNHYTTTPLYDYTSLPFTTHHSLLIAALGLIEFSIQWLWSIATNPSLELTGTTHHSRLTTHY
jgi:hypothetical protein